MNWCICLSFCFNRQSLLRERFSIFLKLSHEGCRSTDMVTHVLNFFSHNWTVPNHLLCLKTVSRGCRACTRLSSLCFWLRHVMCHILPVGRSAWFCFGCRTEVVAGLLCFRLCFHPTAGDCEALLCVGTWGFQRATPARVAGCVGASPLEMLLLLGLLEGGDRTPLGEGGTCSPPLRYHQPCTYGVSTVGAGCVGNRWWGWSE